MKDFTHLRSVPAVDSTSAPTESWEEFAQRRFASAKALSNLLNGSLKDELEALEERCAWDDVSTAHDYPASIEASPHPELYRFGRMLNLASVEGFTAFHSQERRPLSQQERLEEQRFQQSQLDALNGMKASPLAHEFSGLIKAADDYVSARNSVRLRAI